MSGKKIQKIKCQNRKKVKKHIHNGKRNLNCLFQKQGKFKINNKSIWLKIVGYKEENLVMDGNKINKKEVEVETLDLL